MKDMKTWNLTTGDPLCLTLSADARLCAPNYSDDQTWELSLEGEEPPALTLQTTYGLRAGWMRLFPRFIRAGKVIMDPAGFALPPRLRSFYPNALTLAFSPFQGIDALLELWVPTSQSIAARLHFTNQSVLKDSFRIELAGMLNPLGQGESMSAVQAGANYILRGKTEEIFPVLALSVPAQPVSSPFPALGVEVELFPGNTRVLTLAMASLKDPEASLETARQVILSPWEGEAARIAMLQQNQGIEIETGFPDWDAAFAFTQKTAFSLFFPGGGGLPQPSFVTSRTPEQGYSPRGDGSDYPYAWSGQTGLESLFLAGLVLPGAPQLAKGLLQNFLATQAEDGRIDWKPGLAGQRGRHLAQPLLAELAWQIDRAKNDSAWLAEIYPGLVKFIRTWLNEQHDRDRDGFPEWDHPLQTGYEDNPLFDRWHPGSQGAEITRIESPSLPALLYREVNVLIKIARRCGHEDDLPWLEEQAAQLRAAVESTWDEQAATYRFRDYQTHRSGQGFPAGSWRGSGQFQANQQFAEPVRLLLFIQAAEDTTRAARVLLTGRGDQGEISETIPALGFQWAAGLGRATTQAVFTSLERIEVEGLEPRDTLTLRSIDFTQEAVSLLLPLWAGIPSQERAAQMIDQAVFARYLGPYGLPMCPPRPDDAGFPALAQVHMGWNQLIGEGLLAYGRRNEAAELVTHLMNAVVSSLKDQRTFRQYYHARTGQPLGERNALTGLAPIKLFLQTAGIESIRTDELILRGNNPFPWPINVKYRGIKVACGQQETAVEFPTGQTVHLDGPGPYRLSLS